MIFLWNPTMEHSLSKYTHWNDPHSRSTTSGHKRRSARLQPVDLCTAVYLLARAPQSCRGLDFTLEAAWGRVLECVARAQSYLPSPLVCPNYCRSYLLNCI